MGLIDALSHPNGGNSYGSSGGLLDLLLGTSNPVSQFADSRQNVLGALGAGIASGPTFSQGLANAAQNIPAARKADYQQNLYKGQVSQTVAYLIKNHPDLAQMVQSGTLSPSDAFNMAYQQDNQKGIALAPGATLVNPQTGAPMGGSGDSNGFYGSDLKAQAWNTVLKGNNDPAQKGSPQYRAAWAIVTEPTMTPQGMMQPNVPPQWAPDAGAAPTGSPATGQAATGGYGGAYQPAAPASGAPTPTSASVGDMAMVAPPANVQTGPGVIPGTQPFNESQSRSTDLASMAIPDLKTAIANYPALTDPRDQALQKVSQYDPTGLAHGAQSEKYQRAYSGTRAAISNILYTVSGAAIGDKELERKIEDLTPQLGDKPGVVSDKLNRLANYVMSIANSTRDTATIARANQAVQGIKAAQDQIAGSVAPSASQSVPAGTPIWGPDGKQYVMGPDGNPQPVM